MKTRLYFIGCACGNATCVHVHPRRPWAQIDPRTRAAYEGATRRSPIQWWRWKGGDAVVCCRDTVTIRHEQHRIVTVEGRSLNAGFLAAGLDRDNFQHESEWWIDQLTNDLAQKVANEPSVATATLRTEALAKLVDWETVLHRAGELRRARRLST